jgi:response regulator RpfG family c-di-GMP phosphodiesterase
MAVTVKVLIQAKTAESTNTVQYTSATVSTIIDKFTATNYGATTATLSINLVPVGLVVSDDNLIVKAKILQPQETYTFPEIVGASLNSGDFISTVADTASSINIRASGRLVS